MKLECWSDGSATIATKPGGWGCVLVSVGEKGNTVLAESSGHIETASNNDAELLGAIESLQLAFEYITLSQASGIFDTFEVTLVSDSKLILGWASGEYQFKQMDKIDKYQKLQRLMKALKADTKWVRGHSGIEINERCDQLANNARLKLSNEIETKEKKANGETLIGKRKTGIVCLYYKNKLKIVDLRANIVEDYDRELHGSRGGILEVREERTR